ncbi:MAG: Stp1/IreP family PP2C-type Ser/Thr phosphatase [bacterium]
MKAIGFGLTDRGKRRPLNEDYYICDNENNIYVVADGMGGIEGGELASKMAVDVFLTTIYTFLHDEEITLPFEIDTNYEYLASIIKYAADQANASVYKYGLNNPAKRGMGTTFTVALANGEKLYVGHIGDSRLYRVRGGEITQLSEDHTLVHEMVKIGKITPQEARFHPKKNIITRSLGPRNKINLDLFSEQLMIEDIYLLCSDGLYGMVEEEEFHAELLSYEGKDLEDLGKNLISLANEGGGRDNITLILFKIEK